MTDPPRGKKRCTGCGRWKRLRDFAPRADRGPGAVRSRCYLCRKAEAAAYRRTDHRREWQRAYQQRPEVKERARRRRHERREAGAEDRRDALRRTVLGRACNAIRVYRTRLRRAGDPARRARLAQLIRLWEAERDRLRAG